MKTIAMAVAGLALGFAGAASAQNLPATKFNVVGSIGNLSMYTQKEQPFWTDHIKKVSGGAIDAQVKPFTELGLKGPEVFRLVSQGTLQMATSVLNYSSGEVPIHEATDLAGMVGTVEELEKLVNIFRPTLAKEFEVKHGAKLLGHGSYQAQVIYCRDEIKALADLKGKKVRASGAAQQAFVAHIGGSPLNIAFAEVQPALQKGVVDCAITGALSGYRSKWYEAANYLMPMPVSFGLAATIANLKWWNTLDPKVQALLEKEIMVLEKDIFAQAKGETAIGVACNTGTGPCPEGQPAKMKLVPISAADQALRKQAFEKAVLPSFAQRCGKDCVDAWNATVGKELGIKAGS